MELTGKAKEQFEEWLKENYSEFFNDRVKGFGLWELLPPSMRWGVYQDWADSLGIECVVEYFDSKSFGFWVHTQEDTVRLNSVDGFSPTRQEARTAAIEKLNELINEG